MKILAFTSIRSDYDLMSELYKLLDADKEIDFKLIVSGAHLSPSFGYSIEQIKEDGFEILLEIETLLNSDTGLSRIKTASLLLQNSLETISKYSPDLMIYAGDREDVIIYAMIGGYLNIPTLHFYAGDHVADGYIDNPIRHATSKIASAHCVSLNEHMKRLVRMGEKKERICVTGSLSLDRFVSFKPFKKDVIKDTLKTNISMDNYALVIFHPVTCEIDNVDRYFQNILENILTSGMQAFVSYPNIDHGNHKLIDVIHDYLGNENLFFYKNLERDMFLSIYKHANLIIGNSSSGICEAASLRIPAINVGARQIGRLADENVIFCTTEYESISLALKKALSPNFQNKVKHVTNSYGDGRSSIKAYNFIKNTNFDDLVAKVEDPLEVELL